MVKIQGIWRELVDPSRSMWTYLSTWEIPCFEIPRQIYYIHPLQESQNETQLCLHGRPPENRTAFMLGECV
jgi:hypothetical protein